jgi:hypothetical protein
MKLCSQLCHQHFKMSGNSGKGSHAALQHCTCGKSSLPQQRRSALPPTKTASRLRAIGLGQVPLCQPLPLAHISASCSTMATCAASTHDCTMQQCQTPHVTHNHPAGLEVCSKQLHSQRPCNMRLAGSMMSSAFWVSGIVHRPGPVSTRAGWVPSGRRALRLTVALLLWLGPNNVHLVSDHADAAAG